MKKIKIILLMFYMLCFSTCKANEEHNTITNNSTKTITAPSSIRSEIFQSVIDSLINRGVDTAFIKKYINSDKLVFSDRYVKVNVTGYLSKSDYSYVTNQNSITKSKEFLRKNITTLTAAEKQYGVPKEIITAIL